MVQFIYYHVAVNFDLTKKERKKRKRKRSRKTNKKKEEKKKKTKTKNKESREENIILKCEASRLLKSILKNVMNDRKKKKKTKMAFLCNNELS